MQKLKSTLQVVQLDRDEKSDAVAAAEQVCTLWHDINIYMIYSAILCPSVCVWQSLKDRDQEVLLAEKKNAHQVRNSKVEFKESEHDCSSCIISS